MGELLAFIFFGPVACIGTAILLGYADLQKVFLLSIPMGFWSAALMSVNNLRDFHNDKSVNKTTVATLLGEKSARFFTLILLLSPFAFQIFLIQFLKLHWSLAFALFALIPLINELGRILKDPISSEFNLTLAQTGKSLTIYTLINVIIYMVL